MNNGSFDGGLLEPDQLGWKRGDADPRRADPRAWGSSNTRAGYHIDPYIGGTMARFRFPDCCGWQRYLPSRARDATQYWAALLCLANWVGNVILPVYGGIEIARAVLGIGGVFERLNIGDDWIRHFIAGGSCLCVSGLMRLMEHFIATGTDGVA